MQYVKGKRNGLYDRISFPVPDSQIRPLADPYIQLINSITKSLIVRDHEACRREMKDERESALHQISPRILEIYDTTRIQRTTVVVARITFNRRIIANLKDSHVLDHRITRLHWYLKR